MSTDKTTEPKEFVGKMFKAKPDPFPANCITAFLFGGIFLLVIMGFVLSAKMESDTYNRLTGAHTTTWDALWVELRVQDKTMP